MRIGSICSGIGAETLASAGLGWKVDFYSEIEKFPSAVLAYHFPDTPNLGDFTKITADDWRETEIIVGGPPCQSFSIAGKRGGLDDNRGNLTLNYVDMCHDFATNGSLRWAFYENVPGILSDQTNAFGCLISGLVGADDAFTPPDGESWPKCGMATGPRARLAWRVLDAQYFGLAQRRKRVFIVVGFADGCDPAKVLFERKGVFRDIAAGGSEGEGVAGDVERRTTVGSPIGHRMLAFGEYADDNTASTIKERDYKDATDLVVSPPVAFSAKQGGGDSQENICPTLTAGNSDKSHANSGNWPAVAFNSRQDPVSGEIAGALDKLSTQAVAIQDGRGLEKGQNGIGVNDSGTAYTVDTMGGQAVAFKPSHYTRGKDGAPSEIVPPLSADADKGDQDPVIAQAVPINTQMALRGADTSNTSHEGIGLGKPGDPAFTLQAAHHHAVAFKERGGCEGGGKGYLGQRERTFTLSTTHDQNIFTNYAVRGLTPIECARLQGFPDNWTQIPWRNKPAADCPDGPQYKAYGNTWAVNCVAWIFARIDAVDRGVRT